MNRKAIVTGGAGFVGTNLIKRLVSDNWKVVSLDNYCIGTESNHVDDKRVSYYNVDLTETSDYDFFMNDADILFHLAAIPRIQPSLKRPKTTLDNNHLSTVNVLEYARKNNIKVIFSSSSSVVGNVFANPYTVSKHNGENLCGMYKHVYGLEIATARFYNVYGPHMIGDSEFGTVLGI